MKRSTFKRYGECMELKLSDIKSRSVLGMLRALESFGPGRSFLHAAADRWDLGCIERRMLKELSPMGPYLHIDIGAFQGSWSKNMSQLYPNSDFLMVEAHPQSASRLLSQLSEFPASTVLLNLAVTVEDTQAVDLNLTRNPVGTSIRAPREGQVHEWTHLVSTIQVQGRRLDSILDQYGREPIGVLKVDCQGADLEVLRSAGSFLQPRTVPIVVVELNFREFYEDQDPWWSCVSYLQERGYEMLEVELHRDSRDQIHWGDALFSLAK